jgi:hypothetical protein
MKSPTNIPASVQQCLLNRARSDKRPVTTKPLLPLKFGRSWPSALSPIRSGLNRLPRMCYSRGSGLPVPSPKPTITEEHQTPDLACFRSMGILRLTSNHLSEPRTKTVAVQNQEHRHRYLDRTSHRTSGRLGY